MKNYDISTISPLLMSTWVSEEAKTPKNLNLLIWSATFQPKLNKLLKNPQKRVDFCLLSRFFNPGWKIAE